MKYYFLDRWWKKGRETDEELALAALRNRDIPFDVAVGYDDRDFDLGGVLIAAKFPDSKEWHILGHDREVLCIIPMDVYAAEVVLRTARAILDEARQFKPHEVVLR